MDSFARLGLVGFGVLVATACSNGGMELPVLGLEDVGEAIAGELVINADLPAQVAEAHGLTQIDFIPQLGMGLYVTEDGVTQVDVQAALSHATARADLVVESNRPREAFSADPFASLQWNFDMLEIDTAWEFGRGDGVTVAVLDTGVATFGEDTPVNMLAGWDFAGDDDDPTDVGGHGTHVAGTIAQATDNNRGVAGVAPDVSILPVRVLGDNGSGSGFWVAQGVVYAVDQGADVINMSLGSSFGSAVERQAIEYAEAHGVVVVAASGNEGRGSIGFPAAYPSTIAVGAVGADASVTDYSNGGAGLDVVAPGGDLSRDLTGDGYADGILQETVDFPGANYQFFEGTSMATPHVAGVAALLIGAGADPREVKGLIATTAVDIGGEGWDARSGWGLIDPVAALEAIGNAPPIEPADDVVGPVISGISIDRVGASMTLRWTTDEPSTTKVAFDGIGEFGRDELTTVHELGFQIDPGATYAFEVRSTDAAGNLTASVALTSSPE